MPADVETMAYYFKDRDDVPWHGQGEPIDHNATVEEMQFASCTDWTVSKRPMFVPALPDALRGDNSAKGFETFVNYHGKCLAVEDYFALVRDSDNRVFGPCGKDYIPTQNFQAFHFFKKFAEAGRMRLETAGSLQGGRQVWVLAKLAKEFELAGGDRVAGYLLMSSPHIWGNSLVIKFVTIRVVCANTFAMAMKESVYGQGFRMPHVKPFDADAERSAEITLKIADSLMDDFKQRAEQLAKVVVTPDVVNNYIAEIFQPELIVDAYGKSYSSLDEVEKARVLLEPSLVCVDAAQFKRSAYEVASTVNSQPGAGLDSTRSTLWGAFNAITYHTDHLAGRDRDNALTAAWFGNKSVLKTKAMRLAVQMAAAT